MEIVLPKPFSQPVTVFQERRLPERARPAGYAPLIDAFSLSVPLPLTLSAISARHKTFIRDGWRILTPRHEPDATLEGHLTFALKHEGLDLAVLKRLFLVITPQEIEEIVRSKPTGIYARRIWFLYEWLLGRELDLSALEHGTYIEVVDPALQWGGQGDQYSKAPRPQQSSGHTGVLPTSIQNARTRSICKHGSRRACKRVVADVPADLLARTAAFLLLKDSKASYVIEGENPPQDRIQRWGRAIGEAGKRTLDLDELLRLQSIVIGDARFVHMGLRHEGGFVGEHERESRMPLPDHISARPEDLRSLIDGMIAFDHSAAQHIDPIIAATLLAFGFVYAHPFEDGNGRVHRYLIHHVLAQRGFNPTGIVFPVSAAILSAIDQYKSVLESYSKRLLPNVKWKPTASGNVEVLNDTGDFYRFFDATPHAEFLYDCVRRTIEEDLPAEADYLRRYDRFRSAISAMVDMPDSTADLLFSMLKQNGGRLSKRARQKEFAALTDEETSQIEQAFADIIVATG